MSVSINIGTNPTDIDNINKIRNLLHSNTIDKESNKDLIEWVDEIHKFLTDPSIFSQELQAV